MKTTSAMAIFAFVYWGILMIYHNVVSNYIWFFLCVFFVLISLLIKYRKVYSKRIPLWLVVAVNVYTSVGILVLVIISIFIMTASVTKSTKNIDIINSCDYFVVFDDDSYYNNQKHKISSILNKTLEYATQNEHANIVLVGRGNKNEIKSVEMADYLINSGIEKERLYVETQSNNISEGLIYSMALINMLEKNRTIIEKPVTNMSNTVLMVKNKPKKIAVICPDYNLLRILHYEVNYDNKNMENISVKTDRFLLLNNLVVESLKILKSKFLGN